MKHCCESERNDTIVCFNMWTRVITLERYVYVCVCVCVMEFSKDMVSRGDGINATVFRGLKFSPFQRVCFH